MSLRELIILTASYYRQTLSEPILEMYAEDLADLPVSEVMAAYKSFRRDPKNRTFPLPAQIRDLVNPNPTPEAEARAVSGRISEAIVRYGYSNPKEAKLFIGEVGWSIVQSWGGWSYICQNHGLSIDPGQFEAQTRNRAMDAIQYGKLLGYTERGQIAVDHEQRIILESSRQKEAYTKHLALTYQKAEEKEDPNSEYLAMSIEQRNKVIEDFLVKINSKQLT